MEDAYVDLEERVDDDLSEDLRLLSRTIQDSLKQHLAGLDVLIDGDEETIEMVDERHDIAVLIAGSEISLSLPSVDPMDTEIFDLHRRIVRSIEEVTQRKCFDPRTNQLFLGT